MKYMYSKLQKYMSCSACDQYGCGGSATKYGCGCMSSPSSSPASPYGGPAKKRRVTKKKRTVRKTAGTKKAVRKTAGKRKTVRKTRKTAGKRRCTGGVCRRS